MAANDYKDSAQRELNTFLDSISGRIQKFKNEVHEFVNDLISSDIVKGFYDIGTTVMKIANERGAIVSIITAFSSILLTKSLHIFSVRLIGDRNQLLLFGNQLKDVTATVKTFFVNLQQVGLKSGFTNFMKNTGASFKNLVKTLWTGKNEILTNQYIALEQKITETGLSAEEAAKAMGNIDKRVVQYIATTDKAERNETKFNEQLGLVSLRTKAANLAVGALNIALNTFISLGISMAINAVVSGIQRLTSASERAREEFDKAVETFKEETETISKQAEKINELGEEYATLSKKVTPLGKNQGLTNEEFNRYKEITEELSEIFPELIKGYNDQNEVILVTKGSIEGLNKALDIQKFKSYNEILEKSDEVMKEFGDKASETANKTDPETLWDVTDKTMFRSTIYDFNKFYSDLLSLDIDNMKPEDLSNAIINLIKESTAGLDESDIDQYEIKSLIITNIREAIESITNDDIGKLNFDLNLSDAIGSSLDAIVDDTSRYSFGNIFEQDEEGALKVNLNAYTEFLAKLREGILKANDDMESELDKVKTNLLLPYFERNLLLYPDNVLNKNEDLANLARQLINNVNYDLVAGFDGDATVAKEWVESFIDNLSKAANGVDGSKLVDSFNILFNDALLKNGELLDGKSVIDQADEYKAALDHLKDVLGLEDYWYDYLYNEVFNIDELDTASKEYNKKLNDIIYNIFGMEKGSYINADDRTFLDTYLKENGINTVDEINEFFNKVEEASESGIHGWKNIFKYWENFVNQKLSKKLSITDLFAVDSTDKDLVTEYETNIQKIDEAIEALSKGERVNEADILSTFADDLEELGFEGEITADILGNLANVLYDKIRGVLSNYDPKESKGLIEYLEILKNEAVTTGDIFESTIERIARGTRFGDNTYDRKLVELQTFTKNFSNAEKDIFVKASKGAKTVEDAINKFKNYFNKKKIESLPQLLSDEDFQAMREEAEQLSSILENGITGDERQTILETWGLTADDIEAGTATELQDYLDSLVYKFAEKGGEAGLLWYENWIKNIKGSSDKSINFDDLFNIEFTFNRDGKDITQSFNDYVSDITSKTETLGNVISGINSRTDASNHTTWTEVLGNPETLKNLEIIIPGISEEIKKASNNANYSETVVQMLIDRMSELYGEYQENSSTLIKNNNLTDEAKAALERYGTVIGETVQHATALKNGLKDVSDNLDHIYFDREYENARSFSQAISDTKDELTELNNAYNTLSDTTLTEQSATFKETVNTLLAKFPELESHTGSIKELSLAITELMEIKGNNLILSLEQLAARSDITDELRNKIELAIDAIHRLGNQPFTMENVFNTIKTARNEMNQFAEFVNKVNKKGLHLNMELSDEVYNFYPELLKDATLYRDGTIELNKDVYNSFKSAKEQEIQGDVKAKITELENANKQAEAEIKLEETKIKIAEEALKTKSRMKMEEALAEIKALEETAKANTKSTLSKAEDDVEYTEGSLANTKARTDAEQEGDAITEETKTETTLSKAEDDVEYTEGSIDNTEARTDVEQEGDLAAAEFAADAYAEKAENDATYNDQVQSGSEETTEKQISDDIDAGEANADVLKQEAENDAENSEAEQTNSEQTSEKKIEDDIKSGEVASDIMSDLSENSAGLSDDMQTDSNNTASTQQEDYINTGEVASNVISGISKAEADESTNAQTNSNTMSIKIQEAIGNIISKAKEWAIAIKKAANGDDNFSNSGVAGISTIFGNAIQNIGTFTSKIMSNIKGRFSQIVTSSIQNSIQTPNENIMGGVDKRLAGVKSSSGNKYSISHNKSEIDKNTKETNVVTAAINNVFDGIKKTASKVKNVIDKTGEIYSNLKANNFNPDDVKKTVYTTLNNVGKKLDELINTPRDSKIKKLTWDDVGKAVRSAVDYLGEKILGDSYRQEVEEKLTNIIAESNGRIDELKKQIESNNYFIELLKNNAGIKLDDFVDRVAKELADKDKDSGKGDSGSGDKGDSGDKGAEDKANEYKDLIDWIEVRIARIERIISKLDKVSGNSFENFVSRNKAIIAGINNVEDEMATAVLAYDRYSAEAESIALDEGYKERVRKGLIDIETITDETVRNQIQAYQGWYEKSLEMLDKIYDLAQKTSEYYQQVFDNIKSQADGIISHYESTVQMINNAISRTETQGYLVSEKYYEELIKNAKSQLQELEGERVQLIRQFQESVDSGAVEMYSESWYNMRNAIDEVTLSIDQLNTSMVEYNDTMRQLSWDAFDLQINRISDITSEAQFMIDLMANETLYNKDGYITNRGIATKAMHGLQYNIDMELADQLHDELMKINEDLANDPNNTKLYDRRQQLLEQQREMILAANSEKEALKSLVSDGISKTLEAMQKLISTYTEALDKQHDMYTYQQDIEQQTKNITDIQKQLTSLSGDDTEENRKRLQELNNSLQEAQKNLEETEISRAISDTKDLLNELYNNFDSVLNARLDNLDVLIAENIAQINLASGQISDTLNVIAGDVGYEFQNGVQDIFTHADENLMPALSMYTSELMTQLTNDTALQNDALTNVQTGVIDSITTNATNISAYINTMAAAMGVEYETANGLIGDSIFGIRLSKEAMDLARSTLNETILNNGGSIRTAIALAKELLSTGLGSLETETGNVDTSIGNVNNSIGKVDTSIGSFASTVSGLDLVFKKDFSDTLTSTQTEIGGVTGKVQSMIEASDYQAKQIMFKIDEEMNKANVSVTEGSAASINEGVYSIARKLDDIVRYTTAIAYNTMTKSQVPDREDPVIDDTPGVGIVTQSVDPQPHTNTISNDSNNSNNDTNNISNVNNIQNNNADEYHGDGVPQVDDVVTYHRDEHGNGFYFDSSGTVPTYDIDADVPNAAVIEKIATGQDSSYWTYRKRYLLKLRNRSGWYGGWVSLDQLEGYHTGTKSVNNDKYAFVNENGLETIVRPDGSILTPLAKQSMVINAQATENMWRMLQDPEKFMGTVMKEASFETTNNNGGNIENNINITIPINHVQDFDDFMNQLQHSEKFEQLFDAMSNSRLKGTSKFNKFNVRFA